MAATYATAADVQARMLRTLSPRELEMCGTYLEDAAVIIDAAAPGAAEAAKKTVSCRMVMRALGDGGDSGIPMGASQGTMSALGYSQSWAISTGTAGELYLGKLEKQLLGMGNAIGCTSPVEALVPEAEA